MNGFFELQYVEGHERKTHSIHVLDRAVAEKEAVEFLAGRRLISLEFMPTGPMTKPLPRFPVHDAN